MKNKLKIYQTLYLLFLFIFFYSCKYNKCYNIREWEVTPYRGEKFIYTDTVELCKEPLKGEFLDTLLKIDTIAFLNIDNNRFSIEASNLLVWRNDTINVIRVLKDGNLTFFYSRQFGVLMTFSRQERTELLKIKNSCTEQTVIMHDFIEMVLNDAILRPLYERKPLE